MFRWEMELMMIKMWDNEDVADRYEHIMSIMDTLSHTMTNGPEWTDSLVLLMFDMVEMERIVLLNEMERQRLEMQLYASSEREILLEAISQEREVILAEVKSLTDDSIQSGTQSVEKLTENWFWKALILLLVFLAGLIIYGLIRRSGNHS